MEATANPKLMVTNTLTTTLIQTLPPTNWLPKKKHKLYNKTVNFKYMNKTLINTYFNDVNFFGNCITARKPLSDLTFPRGISIDNCTV